MFSKVAALTAVLATMVACSQARAESQEQISPIQDIELVYRYVADRPLTRKQWWKHVGEVERGVREYSSFHLSPVDPSGPLPVACRRKGQGTSWLGIGAIVPLPTDSEVENFVLLVEWKRDAKGVKDYVDKYLSVTSFDYLRRNHRIYRDSNGRDVTFFTFGKGTNYWFKRNGRISLRVAIYADVRTDERFEKPVRYGLKGDIETTSLKADFIVQGCEK